MMFYLFINEIKGFQTHYTLLFLFFLVWFSLLCVAQSMVWYILDDEKSKLYFVCLKFILVSSLKQGNHKDCPYGELTKKGYVKRLPSGKLEIVSPEYAVPVTTNANDSFEEVEDDLPF